jgi:serine/threonine protein kinase
MKICSLCQRCYDDEAVHCVEEGHPALPEPRDRDRHCVAGYSLEYLLKSGQNWETYRAAESVSGHPCLIRILSSYARNGEQFLGEATLAATLFNPSFADVYDAGTLDGGEFFAVTEETEGETVRQLLNSAGPPKLLTTVEIIRQTAEALEGLHAGGLVHRAIRPENIVLTTDTDESLVVRLKCPDFGGAIERSITSNKFLLDAALDSLRYYAPEQFTGEAATPQTDLYSLGIVLFEMLAGVPPFDAPKATALIAKHRNQQPPELRIADFNLRMLLTHTLKESLHKTARLRQSSASAFARQLRHIEQLATHVSTPPPAGTVPVPTRERPVVIAAAAAPAIGSAVQPVVFVETESKALEFTERPARPEIEREATEIFVAEEEPASVEPRRIETFVVDNVAKVEPPPTVLERAMERLRGNIGNENDVDEISTSLPVEPEPVLSHADAFQIVVAEPTSVPTEAPTPVTAENANKREAANAVDRARVRFRKRKLRSKVIRAVNAIADAGPARATEAAAPPLVVTEPVRDDEPNRSGIRLPDRNAVEAAMKEALAARSAKPVKKIELRLFDDDVPTDSDVLTSSAIDQAVDLMLAASKPVEIATAAPIEVAAPPAAKIPKRIEWEQPEDDIPTEADVLEALAQDDVREPVQLHEAASVVIPPLPEMEPATPRARAESPALVSIPEPPPPVVISEPVIAVSVERPAEASMRPEPVTLSSEGLPRVDTVTEKEPVVVPPVQKAVVATRPFVAPSFKRTRIEFDETAKDLRRGDEIIEVKASEDPDRTSVVEHDPDEITRVAPPSRRIRIDVKQPGRWKVTPPAGYHDTFVPTILGSKEDELPAAIPDPDHKDPILSVYYGAADSNRRSPYRSMIIGGGFLAAVVMLLFGNVLVREEAKTEAAGTTVVSKTFPPQTSPQQSGRTSLVPPVKEKPEKVIEKPTTETDDATRGDTAKGKEDSKSNKEQSKTNSSRSDAQNRPTRSASVKPVNEKPNLVPSTIVISSNNGKVNSKVEPQNKPAIRSGPTPAKKPAATRPRIVMVP